MGLRNSLGNYPLFFKTKFNSHFGEDLASLIFLQSELMASIVKLFCILAEKVLGEGLFSCSILSIEEKLTKSIWELEEKVQEGTFSFDCPFPQKQYNLILYIKFPHTQNYIPIGTYLPGFPLSLEKK